MESEAKTLGFIPTGEKDMYTHGGLPGKVFGIELHGEFKYKGDRINYDPSWDASYDPEDEESGTYYPDDVKEVGRFLIRVIAPLLHNNVRVHFAKMANAGFTSDRIKLHNGSFMACFGSKKNGHFTMTYNANPSQIYFQFGNYQLEKSINGFAAALNGPVKNTSGQNTLDQFRQMCIAVSNLTIEVQALKQAQAKK